MTHREREGRSSHSEASNGFCHQVHHLLDGKFCRLVSKTTAHEAMTRHLFLCVKQSANALTLREKNPSNRDKIGLLK